MNNAIEVKGLTKQYRIGLKDAQKDTLFSQLGHNLLAPVRNFRRLRNLTHFDNEEDSIFTALNNISFEVKEGEVLGIIGHNGAGKSTLLKLLSRITSPSKGTIKLQGKVASLLEVGTGFHQDLSGRENIYMNGTILGMTRREIDAKLDEIIAFSGIEKHIDTPVKFYSSGMGVRLGFAVAAHLEPEILIVDEVLAVGDLEFQNKCLRKMEDVAHHGRTILFVSHNMAAIRALCNRGIVLKKGSIIFDGQVQDAVGHYLESYKTKELTDGRIPDNLSTYTTGEAKFRRLLLSGEKELQGNLILHGEVVSLILEIEVFEKIRSGILDVKVVSKEGIEIVHLSSLYDHDNMDFEPGNYNLLIRFQCKLQPSFYSFSIGIHKPNGFTIDYVETINEFEVINTLPLAADWMHGYIVQNATWELSKK
jgi:lipopolysaccharide transport system ATP-binding protein